MSQRQDQHKRKMFVKLSSLMIGSILVYLAGFAASGQPQDKGITLLNEGNPNENRVATLGDLIFEPLQVSALVGSTAEGSVWTELSVGTGLWLGDMHLSGDAELRGVTLVLNLDAETQLDNLGISAGVRVSSGGVQLSGAVRTTLENFTLAGRLAADSGGISLNASAITHWGDFDVHLGAGFSGSELSASVGATLPLPGNLIVLSTGASYDRSGLSVSGGADVVLSNFLSFSANASFGSTGLMTEVGGQLNFETLNISAHGTWSGESTGLTADGKLNLAPVTLLGTLRLDENSFSADVGISTQWGDFTPTLTIGLDQQGFKWVQLEVTGEFNVLGWLSRSEE